MHDLTGNLAYDDFFRKTHARLYFYRMKVQFAIDRHFVENYGEEADERIAGVFNHVQNFFLDPSLGMKFHLEKLEPIHLREKFDVTTRDLE